MWGEIQEIKSDIHTWRNCKILKFSGRFSLKSSRILDKIIFKIQESAEISSPSGRFSTNQVPFMSFPRTLPVHPEHITLNVSGGVLSSETGQGRGECRICICVVFVVYVVYVFVFYVVCLFVVCCICSS